MSRTNRAIRRAISSQQLLLARQDPVVGVSSISCFGQTRNFADDGGAQPMKKQSPAQKKKQQAAAAQDQGGGDSFLNTRYNMVKGALDAPVTKPPPASAEEMERRYQVGRNYVIGNFERHNEMEHDLACKIKLKNHAIKMLPKGTHLRQAALEVDDVGPPAWRHIPVWTPPIPGFDPDEFLEGDEK